MTAPAGPTALPRLAARARLGAARLRVSWWGVVQSALAAALAWELAVLALGHSGPFFAAVAAIVCLSTSYLNRVRRVGELAAGVTLGVLVGDLIVREIGRGAWQLGVVVVLAMAVALLFEGAPLVVNQAALQAVFVVTLPPPVDGYVGRWLDALVGGAVALAVAFALPSDPRRPLRRAADDVVGQVSQALRRSVAAARVADVERAADALELGRATQPALDRWREAVAAGEEVARISPLRRRARPEIAAHRRGVGAVDHAVRNVRVILRRVVAAVEDDVAGAAAGDDGARLPAELLDVLEALAGAFHTLPGALVDPDGEGGRRAVAALTALADRLRPDALGAASMTATVLVAQVRSAVVDLLQVPGVGERTARTMLPR